MIHFGTEFVPRFMRFQYPKSSCRKFRFYATKLSKENEAIIPVMSGDHMNFDSSTNMNFVK